MANICLSRAPALQSCAKASARDQRGSPPAMKQKVSTSLNNGSGLHRKHGLFIEDGKD